ncbi:mannose-1-phosphate guanylyltransferase [Prolixibacteraceae bacterium JC049]|nr:mannose-1-phosphate guanylyltransferase [Prolixibacteraceae bacterium JC049]
MDNTYCVIMAGGIGSRFWPMSRTSRPKQFLDILGTGKSLIRETYERFLPLCKPENILVVTSESYKDQVLEHIPEMDESQVLAEPLRRNTAPCIAYACSKIYKKDKNAVVVIAPSDHLITKSEEFIRQLENGVDFARNNPILLTMGIEPHRPETGYGYIQVNGKKDWKGMDNLHKVKTFTEKPDLKMAQIFMESGEFFWNSGIFIWSAKTILENFNEHLPEIGLLFEKGKKQLNTPDEKAFILKTYRECQNISIDYGIMEKASNVYVMTVDIGWSDLGTWGSLYENLSKDQSQNTVTGKQVVIYDSENCIVNMPDDKVAILQGLNDYIVVERDNTLLVCKKENEQEIRTYVNDLKMKQGKKF